MPLYENPTRNVLQFGACPPHRARGVILCPRTFSPSTLPREGALVIDLSEREAKTYLDKGLLCLRVGAPPEVKPKFTPQGRPVPGMEDVKVHMTSSLPTPADEDRPRPSPTPAPAPAKPTEQPVQEKVAKPVAKPAVKVGKPFGKPVVKTAPKAAVAKPIPAGRPMPVKPMEPVAEKVVDPLADDHPMREKEKAMDAAAVAAPALASSPTPTDTPEPPAAPRRRYTVDNDP